MWLQGVRVHEQQVAQKARFLGYGIGLVAVAILVLAKFVFKF